MSGPKTHPAATITHAFNVDHSFNLGQWQTSQVRVTISPGPNYTHITLALVVLLALVAGIVYFRRRRFADFSS